MFDYTFSHWFTFLTAAFLLNLSPGPDMAFILSQTVKKGMPAGFCAMFGIWLGATIHVFFAAFGLSIVLATSAIAFSIVKWVGAIYLIWLGIQALRSDGSLLLTNNKDNHSMAKVFKQGFWVAVLNPKVAIFFLAFLPQFTVVGAGPINAQLFLHGILVIAVAALVEPPIILIGGKLNSYLSNNRKASKWMDRWLGGVFISLGIKLALTRKI
ncbi:LysE family translocator [Vibrio salinus]|uniref:LysE family translocator n=1 Tax=Vibrio salinus TaxID=2899784 RepID=UPI001E5A28FA|nr:LysE family translocator [Vibrio salinus]MCE0495061.1 LysE family translocator [Vibrio salinus]